MAFDPFEKIDKEENEFYGIDPNTGAIEDKEYYYNPITGRSDADAPLSREENFENAGFLDNILSGIKAGASGVLSGQATLADTFAGVGGDMADDLKAITERNTRTHNWNFDTITSNPMAYITDPQGLAYDAGNMTGSALMMGAETAALGTAAGAAGVGNLSTLANYFAGKAAAHGLPSLAKALSSKYGSLIVANVAKTPIEVSSESGNVIQDMKEEGITDKGQLQKAAAVNALIQTPLLTLSNSVESLGLGTMFGKNISSKAGKAALGATGVVGGALQQSWEEGMQRGASDYAKGKQPGGLTSVVDPFEWTQGQKDEAMAAMGPGMLFGGAGALGSRIARRWADRDVNDVDARDFNPNDPNENGPTPENGGPENNNNGPSGSALDETIDTTATEGPEETVSSQNEEAAAPASSGEDISSLTDDLASAITGQESGGDTEAVNSSTGAYGSMQILPSNWEEWSTEALGHVGDMNNVDDYNATAKHKLEQYVRDYGPEGAAVAWYAGEQNGKRYAEGLTTGIDDEGNEYSFNAPQSTGPSVNEYVASVMSKMQNGGGSSSAVSSFTPEMMVNTEGKTWDRLDDSVDVENVQDVTKAGLADIADVYYNTFGVPLTVTSGNDSGVHADGPHSHYAGVKLDVSGGVLDDAKKRHAFIEECEKRGIEVLDEYENPSPNSTGGHLDLDFTNYNGGSNRRSRGGVSSTVSGISLKDMTDYLKENQREFDEFGMKDTIDDALGSNDPSKIEDVFTTAKDTKDKLNYLKENQRQFDDPDLNNAIDEALTSKNPNVIESVYNAVKKQNDAQDAETNRILSELRDEMGLSNGNLKSPAAGPQVQKQTATTTTTAQKKKGTLPTFENLNRIPFIHRPFMGQVYTPYNVSTVNNPNGYSNGLINLAQRAMQGDQKAADLFSKIREWDRKALEDMVREQPKMLQQAPQAPAQTTESSSTVNPSSMQENAPVTNSGAQEQRYANSPRGNTTTIESDDQTKYKAQYRLADANDLVVSHDTDSGMNIRTNPAYPSQFQPRDRNNATMRQQVISISNKLDPGRLMDSQMINTGAPVVNSNGIVLNGNGRAMGIKAAYRNGRGAAYKKALKANAQRLGLNPADVDKMKNPVLVREVNASPDEMEKIIISKVGGAEMNAAERAVLDSKKVKDSTLERFIDNTSHSLVTTANANDYVLSVLKDITGGDPNKLNPLLNDRMEPSKEGVERARNAVFAMAYGDGSERLLNLVTMDTDSPIKSYTTSMVQVSPVFALLNKRIQDGMRYNINVTGPIAEAGNRLDGLRKNNTKLSIYLQEQALLPDLSPEAHAILQFVDESGRGSKNTTEFFTTMANIINQLGNPKEDATALFQDEGVTPDQIKPIDVVDYSYHVMKGDAEKYALGQTGTQLPQESSTEQGDKDVNPEPEQGEKPEGENGNARERHNAGEDEISSEGGEPIQPDEAGNPGEKSEQDVKPEAEKAVNNKPAGEVVQEVPKGKADFEYSFQGINHDYKQTAKVFGNDIYVTGMVRPADKALKQKNELVKRTMKFDLRDFDKRAPEKIKKLAVDTKAGIFNMHPINRGIVGKYMFPTFKEAYKDTFPVMINPQYGPLRARDTDWGNFTSRAQGVADDLADAYYNSMMAFMNGYAEWKKAQDGVENPTANAANDTTGGATEASQAANSQEEVPSTAKTENQQEAEPAVEAEAKPAPEAKPAVDTKQQRYGNDHYFSDSVTDSGSGRTWARVGIQKGYNVLNGEFKRANKLAKEHKGHYSKFGGERGWVFNTDADRDAFLKDARHDAVDVPEIENKPVSKKQKEEAPAQAQEKAKKTAQKPYEDLLKDYSLDKGIKQIRDNLRADKNLAIVAKNNTEQEFELGMLGGAEEEALNIYNAAYDQKNQQAIDDFADLLNKRNALKTAMKPYVHDLYEWLRNEAANKGGKVTASETKQNKDNGKPENGIMKAEETGKKGAEKNVKISVPGVAPRTGKGAGENTMGESRVQGSGSDGRSGQNREKTGEGPEEHGTGNRSVSDSGTSAGGKTGNSTVQAEKSEDRRAGSPKLPGSIADSYAGAPDDGRKGPEELVKSVKDRPKHENPVTKAQEKENNQKLNELKKALPMLAPEQVNDVMLAEGRLEKANGMMFTNGTGTGKTYTGMGVVKRFYDAGKQNVIVLAPSDDILKGWEEAAKKSFNIKLTRLQDTTDSGKGPVTTTYANAGENKKITQRNWDLIVCDESHKLMSGAKAEPTKALNAVRAMSAHDDGFYRYFEDKYTKEYEDITNKRNELNELETRLANRMLEPGETLAELREAIKDKEDAYNKAYNEYDKLRRKEEELYKKRPKSKVLFLSATPFQYVNDLDYANGYLFNYSDYGPMEQQGYNRPNGKQQFYIENFGYSMRYNQLNKPGADVDSTVMEQSFNEKMMKSGALHGRMLSSDYDYDRGFIRVDAGVGKKIDDGFNWLSDHYQKYDALADVLNQRFRGFYRFYLLEAIKAKSAIPIIKDYVKEGKKVVVFHNFNKGGADNPFILPEKAFSQIEPERQAALTRQYESFINERPDLLHLKLSSLKSPIETLSDAFGKSIAIYNGTLSKKERSAAIKAFNNDDSPIKIILVQSDAGQAGISLHDTTGKHQRVLINLGLPTKPSEAIQQEGRIYRFGNKSNALFRYLNTGTNFEQMAFAQKVAERAGTVENLAMGENARALKNSYVQAYEESQDSDDWKKYLPSSKTEGTGGKEIDYQQETMDDFDRAKAFYFGKQKKDARTKSREGIDYFATPEPLGEKMVEWLHAQPGDSLLEPSAGDGAIARWMPNNTSNTVVEPSNDLQARLMRNVNNVKLFKSGFELMDLHNKFNGIVMNPPFGLGGKTAIEHVAKAYKHLKDGGRLIAIIPDGPAANKRFDKWFNGDPDASRWQDRGVRDGVIMATINLPGITFKRAGTAVRTKLVVIDKYSDPDLRSKAASLADGTFDLPGDSINELFDNLENISMPDRLSDDGKRYSVREEDNVSTEPTEKDYFDSLNDNNETTDSNIQRSIDSLKQEVRDAFPQAEISDIDNSQMKVKTAAGTITVDLEKNIIVGEKAEKKARKEHGMDSTGNIVVEGYYKQGGLNKDAVIALSQESSEGSAYHEAFHAAWDMALNDKEKAAMTKYYSKHTGGKTVSEAMADGYKEWKKQRTEGKGSYYGKLFQKVNDFVSKAKAILTGVENVHNVMRKVAEGNVWNRSAEINDAAMRAASNRSSNTAEQQEYKSAGTSLNQIPAMFKRIPWKQGTKNIDIGGGKYNTATEYLRNQHDVENIVFDPYNRTKAENEKAMEAIRGKADTVTVANVLNVIKESAWRRNVILQAAKALKKDGTTYFQIYEGNKSGVGNATQKQQSYQNNMKASEYVGEIQDYFKDVERKGNVIIAKNPDFNPADKAVWSMDDLATDDVSFSIRSAADNLKTKLKGDKNERIKVAMDDVVREMSITQTLLRSPSYIAEHVKRFAAFFKMAVKAQETQEHLRNLFNKQLNRIHHLYLHSKQDVQDWANLLWQGDAEGKEYSRKELRDMGVAENVANAYSATRAMINHVYNMLNETRNHVETTQKRMTKPQLKDLMQDKFADITRVEDRGPAKKGSLEHEYLVTYKRPKTWRTTDTVDEKMLKQLKSDPNIQVLSEEKKGKNYEIVYEERRGDIHKLEGYIPHFFHDFFVVVKDEEGNNVVVGSGRNIKDAYKKAEAYIKEHPDYADNVTISPKSFNFGDNEHARAVEIGDGQYFEMVKKCEDQLNMSMKEAREFLEDKVKTKNRHRFFGNFLQRKGALGFEENIDWVLHHYLNAASRYIALEPFKSGSISLFERYFGAWNKDYNDNQLAHYVKDYINDVNGNPNSLEMRINEWLNSIPFWRDFVSSKFGDRAALELTNRITSTISVAKLGFCNVSSALLNLGQIVNAYGITGDMKATLKAGGHALRPSFKDMRVLHDCGIQDNIRLDAGAGGYTAFRPRALLSKTMGVFSFFDTYSRKVAALSGFYHAISEGKNYNEAIEYARMVNRKSNFDYSPVDAPAAFRKVQGSVIGDLMLQFQKYKVKELELMHDITANGPKGKALKFWGMYFLLAGVMQVPVTDWFNDLFKQILGIDYKLKIKGAIMDAAGDSEIGRGLARIAMYGLLAARPVNIDISQRFGMGDFILPPKSTLVDILGGPTLSTITQMYIGIHNNDPLQVLKGFSPALGNYAQVLLGKTVDKKGRTMRGLDSTYDKIVKAVGFRLADESINSDISQVKRQRQSELQEERQGFIRSLLDKEEAGEPRTAEDVQKMKEFGITNKKLKRYRNQRNSSFNERVSKTGSKKFRESNDALMNFAQ